MAYGSILFSENSDFSEANLGMDVPVENLEFFNYFGKDLASSVKNYAPGKGNLGTNGGANIVLGPNYADCRGVSHADGPAYFVAASEPAEWTVIVIAEPNVPPGPLGGSNRTAVFGNMQLGAGSQYFGFGLNISTSSDLSTQQYVYQISNGTLRYNVGLPTDNVFVPKAVLISLKVGGNFVIRNLTDGTSEVYANERTTIATGQPLRVGSMGTGIAAYGASRVYAAAMANRELTETEIQTLYGAMQSYCAVDGVIV